MTSLLLDYGLAVVAALVIVGGALIGILFGLKSTSRRESDDER